MTKEFISVGDNDNLTKYIHTVMDLLSDEDLDDCVEIKLGDYVGVVFKAFDKDMGEPDSLGVFAFPWFAFGYDKRDALRGKHLEEESLEALNETYQEMPRKLGWELSKILVAESFKDCLDDTGISNNAKPSELSQALHSIVKNGVVSEDILNRFQVLNVFYGIPPSWMGKLKFLMDSHVMEASIRGKDIQYPMV